MSAAVQISRDAECFRVELMDDSDASILQELGPYTLFIEGNDVACLPDSEGAHVCYFEGGGHVGLRFTGGSPKGIKVKRFGPVEVEVDLYDPQGFSAVLPELHERPWPLLRENEGCYDVGEQMVFTLAERINDRIDFCGMPAKDAIRLESRRIPPSLRRYLPRDGMALVNQKMARLRLSQ